MGLRMHSTESWRQLIVAMMIASIVCGGCTKTVVETLARYDLSRAAPVEQPVPRTGVYSVRWSDGQELHDVKTIARILRQGELVGFAPTTQRSTIARAGDEQIDLTGLIPPDAVQCLWYHRSKEPTRFTTNLFNGGRATAQMTVLVIVVGAVLIGVAVFAIWVQSIKDD